MFPSGIVVSIQPRWNSGFNEPGMVAAYAIECIPHAVAIRVEGSHRVERVKRALERTGMKTPVIGIYKMRLNELNTLITPEYDAAETLADSGAEYVAMECSERVKMDGMIKAIEEGIAVIADVADEKHADIAYGLGVCAVTTALSGYINKKTHPFVEPDVKLVKKLVGLGVPVIAEGRYRTPKHLEMARDAGAHAVCMGNAIHEPRMITLHSKIIFDGSWKELSKNDYRDLS
jgi:N-acylglucosamine-6-phosphate 2-epimerase